MILYVVLKVQLSQTVIGCHPCLDNHLKTQQKIIKLYKIKMFLVLLKLSIEKHKSFTWLHFLRLGFDIQLVF